MDGLQIRSPWGAAGLRSPRAAAGCRGRSSGRWTTLPRTTLPRTAAALAAVTILAPAAAGAQELPGGLELSGGIYLYHYQPLDLAGVDELTEVYALFLNLDRTEGPWTIHVQGRWRDTRLRSFFPSNVWIQEGWVAYEAPLEGRRSSTDGAPDAEPSEERDRAADSPATLTLRAGKIYQRIGRFWDGSFFGNVHYFDGLKLDPEFGVEAVLAAPLGAGGSEAELYLQGLVGSDRVNGALTGRDLEGEEELEEKGLAAGLRVSASLAEMGGRGLRGTVRLSGLAERVEPPPGSVARDATLEHVAADLELAWGGTGLLYLEWTRRASGGPGELGRLLPPGGTAARDVAGSRTTWWLVGARARLGPVGLRYNVSTAGYDDGGFRERIHQPGFTWHAAESVDVLLEYDDWRRDPAGSPPAPADELPLREERIDRSLNLVLLLTF